MTTVPPMLLFVPVYFTRIPYDTIRYWYLYAEFTCSARFVAVQGVFKFVVVTPVALVTSVGVAAA